MSIGCGCEGTKHYATLDKEGIKSLMTSLRELDKKSLKLYILGEMAVSIYPKPAGRVKLERHFKYSVKGIPICKQAFWCILGVNERTMRGLKKLAAEGTARIVHGNLQRTPHNILSAEGDSEHFPVTKDDPAYIACRQSVDGEAMKIMIGWAGETLPSSPEVLPEVLAAPGLSEDRCRYLDKEIAPFISPPAQSALPWK